MYYNACFVSTRQVLSSSEDEERCRTISTNMYYLTVEISICRKEVILVASLYPTITIDVVYTKQISQLLL